MKNEWKMDEKWMKNEWKMDKKWMKNEWKMDEKWMKKGLKTNVNEKLKRNIRQRRNQWQINDN